MPDQSSNPFNFWHELKRRKVIRVVIVYAAASFVILELISIIEDPFGLPEWTLRFVFVILCIGLIISIIFSWIYDITPEGLEKTKPVKEVKDDTPEKPSGIYAWKIATYTSSSDNESIIVFNFSYFLHIFMYQILNRSFFSQIRPCAHNVCKRKKRGIT